MDTGTYPDSRVSDFVKSQVVPLRLRHDGQPLAGVFNIHWTPTHLVLDAEGREHHRAVGFLPPEELIPFILLGIGKVWFDGDMYFEAAHVLEKLLADYPRSDSAPEAVYLRGVALYKSTGDPKPLKKAYEQLQLQYPASAWTKRAYPYRLL